MEDKKRNNFIIDEKIKEILDCMQKAKHSEISYFVNNFKLYDDKGEFSLVEKRIYSNVYEGMVKGRKICGGDVGVVIISNHINGFSISIFDKNNPIDKYELLINYGDKDSKLVLSSERVLKTITFSFAKKLFGMKVVNVKQKIETFPEMEW